MVAVHYGLIWDTGKPQLVTPVHLEEHSKSSANHDEELVEKHT